MGAPLDPSAAGLDAERLGRIDEYFRESYVESGRIAGFQVVVGRHGHVAHRATVGSMDLESGEQLHDRTIWRWYSMTKPITAVALLSLVERARVKLTDPIHRFLPEWRDVRVSLRRGDGSFDLVELDRPISVKHALMHMTGIGPGPKEARLDMQALMGGGEGRSLASTMTLADLSRLLATEPLRFQPGTRWFYSWSSDICTRLVEVIADESFGDYISRTILDPLGMVDTGFHVPASEAHRVASLYAAALARRSDSSTTAPGTDCAGSPRCSPVEAVSSGPSTTIRASARRWPPAARSTVRGFSVDRPSN